jgi:GT2 family glycosyltransferase
VETCEICVVDGGSRDDTVRRARKAAHPAVRVEVIELEGPNGSAPGSGRRARQLQVGLEATRGDPVVFLHADTRLPGDWLPAVERAMAAPGVSGGSFRFAFREAPARGATGRGAGRLQRMSLGLVERGARLRVRLFGMPYGDQALFARRAVLEELGGIPQVPLMEDLDLVRALKQKGRLVHLSETATTSPRRHLEGGVWRIAIRHALAAAAWAAGADRVRLARWLGR